MKADETRLDARFEEFFSNRLDVSPPAHFDQSVLARIRRRQRQRRWILGAAGGTGGAIAATHFAAALRALAAELAPLTRVLDSADSLPFVALSGPIALIATAALIPVLMLAVVDDKAATL